MSNAPNEYRLVFKRYDYDYAEVLDEEVGDLVVREQRNTIKTHTDWAPFDGSEIRPREASTVEFRYNKESK